MKKLFVFFLFVLLLCSCSPNDVLDDGFYFALADQANADSWKNFVAITVADEKITSVEWNSVSDDFNGTKRDVIVSGEYNLSDSSFWVEQADAFQEILIDAQRPKFIRTNPDLYSEIPNLDKTSEFESFLNLADKALENGVVSIGPYKDGNYTLASEPDKNTWYAVLSVIVRGGNIIGVTWNERNIDGVSKRQMVAEGKYSIPSDKNWTEQANLATKKLIKLQTPYNFFLNDDGTTDVISGVSIKINRFTDLAIKILSDAKSQ